MNGVSQSSWIAFCENELGALRVVRFLLRRAKSYDLLQRADARWPFTLLHFESTTLAEAAYERLDARGVDLAGVETPQLLCFHAKEPCTFVPLLMSLFCV